MFKKKEFFEDEYIQEYWDWQEQYETKSVEDTYFNSYDLWDASFQAHMNEDFYLSHRKLMEYNYLMDHIILQSYDETMDEIYEFLMFEVWKTLDKTFKKTKEKKSYKLQTFNIKWWFIITF